MISRFFVEPEDKDKPEVPKVAPANEEPQDRPHGPREISGWKPTSSSFLRNPSSHC